jgi:hypothetical protein
MNQEMGLLGYIDHEGNKYTLYEFFFPIITSYVIFLYLNINRFSPTIIFFLL